MKLLVFVILIGWLFVACDDSTTIELEETNNLEAQENTSSVSISEPTIMTSLKEIDDVHTTSCDYSGSEEVAIEFVSEHNDLSSELELYESACSPSAKMRHLVDIS